MLPFVPGPIRPPFYKMAAMKQVIFNISAFKKHRVRKPYIFGKLMA